MQKKAKFKLSLFGGFQLTDVDGQLIDPGPRKVKALFAWLAVNPGIEHPREKVAAMFWPDSEEDVARHSLRQARPACAK
jgi:DNA-binding SARP family transcriptional activator